MRTKDRTLQNGNNKLRGIPLCFLVLYSPVSPVFMPWIFYTFYVSKMLMYFKNKRTQQK